MFVDYVPLTTADMVHYGWQFLDAQIDGFKAAAFNTSDGQAPSGYGIKGSTPNPNRQALIYTPVAISSASSLGDPFDVPTVLVAGGTVGCYTTRVDVAPQLSVGSRYVLVLGDFHDPVGNTISGSKEALFGWPVDKDGNVVTVDGLQSVDQLDENISSAESAIPASPQLTK